MQVSQKPGKFTNETRSINSQCKVVVYDWTSKALPAQGGDDSILSQSTRLDISSQIKSCQFTKIQNNPAGNFSFTLSNSPGLSNQNDWKDIIKRGSWCLIYMAQDNSLSISPTVKPGPSIPAEAPYIRCIGFIDRVEVQASISDNGAFDVGYTVSGRDFGVVYEDTHVWLNTFINDLAQFQNQNTFGLSITNELEIHKVLKNVHDLILNPLAVKGAVVGSNGGITALPRQWLMPRQLLRDLGLKADSSPYWGEIAGVTNFEPTVASTTQSDPTSFVYGVLWENLKRLSEPVFHELFTETTDLGFPRLNFRPMPFAINKKDYPIAGKQIKKYLEVDTVEVKATDVLDFGLGEDNHGRYNSFLCQVVVEQKSSNVNEVALVRAGFPFNNNASIKRYGFRNMHAQLNSLLAQPIKNGQFTNFQLLIDYNHVLKDYFNNLVFSESGEINLIGKNEIKIGKCLEADENTPYMYGRRYYIEGYTDTFNVLPNGAGVWTQNVMVTHGYEIADLQNDGQFGTRNAVFKNSGEFTPAKKGGGK